MQIGMIGLGRMGGNMVRRLLRDGHECVVYDRDPEVTATFVGGGGRRAPARSTSSSPGSSRRARRGSWCPRAIPRKGWCRSSASAGGGGRDHRRRQLLLQGRRAARPGRCAEKGDPLRRRRHQRRRLGPGAGLLPDDRRRARRRSSGSIRSGRRWRPGAATCRRRPAARGSRAPPRRATCIAGRSAPATS